MARHQRSLPPARPQPIGRRFFRRRSCPYLFSLSRAGRRGDFPGARPAGVRRTAAGHVRIRPFGQNAPRAAAGSCGAAGSTARASGRDTLLDLTSIFDHLYWTIYVMAAGAGQPQLQSDGFDPPMGRKRVGKGP